MPRLGCGRRRARARLGRMSAGNERGAPSGEDGGQGGFDRRLERLEAIVGELEEGDLGLEGAIERYREGVELLRGCREVLAGYRRQVEELSRGAELVLEPYDGDPDASQGGGAGAERES